MSPLNFISICKQDNLFLFFLRKDKKVHKGTSFQHSLASDICAPDTTATGIIFNVFSYGVPRIEHITFPRTSKCATCYVVTVTG